MRIDLKVKNFDAKIIWILTAFLLCAFYLFAFNTWGRYVLAVVAVLIFALGVAIPRGIGYKVEIGPYHIFLMVFTLYTFLSAIWSVERSATIQKAQTLFQIFLCYSLIYAYYAKLDSVRSLWDCVMWGGYFIAAYSIVAYGGISNVMALVQSSHRLDNVFTNINNIAMICAIACVIQFHRILCKKEYLSAIFAIPAIIMIAATQTRKAIILLALGIIAAVILKNFEGKKLLKSVIGIIVSVFVAVLVLRFLLSLEIFAGVNERMEKLVNMLTGEGEGGASAETRQLYIEVGLQKFMEKPFLGAGIGSSGSLLAQVAGYKTYFHNNFVEMLACGGIVGFAVYYSSYAYLIYNLLKLRRFSRNEADICLILLVILLLVDYGMVSYSSKSQYFYFMICFLQVVILKRKRGEMLNEAKEVA